uniref:SWIM-type domain-containing protein n=1 Tax=Tanacetum cinerariifolium TaxID=118510 RepID=A0A6L2MRF2_TANCI|nr:hypothetical protein [Tanacetum cinerariifolium]
MQQHIGFNQYSQQQQNQSTGFQPPTDYQSDHQSFNLIDETEDENEDEPIPIATSNKSNRDTRLKAKAPEFIYGMDQWAPTEYQNPLPPVIRRMPGKRRTKRRKDASEGVLYRNLFWKAAKASYPAKFQEVMNEIKDLNARKKPIISMLEDIRIYIMERQKRMRDKHVMWGDEIFPNIRKKVEIIKDKHRDWRVIPSGGSKFEARNGYEAFKVNEMNMTCSCRQWQLTGIPCAHGCAAIYFLHKDPDKYVSDWYRKSMFVYVYQHFIHPLDGMDQWAPTEYQNPLPHVTKRMAGKRRTKRRKDDSEGNDKNRTRVSRVGRVIHCTNCHQEGHNRKGCKSSVDGGNVGTQAANGGVGRTKYMVRRGGSSAGRGCSSS